MKTLLIYPPRENYIFGVTPHVYIEADAGNYPPIGMLYIAACLEKAGVCNVEVLDAYTEGLSHEDVRNRIAASAPDVVGVYFSTYYLVDALKTAENAKKANPAAFVVAGGPHTALYPSETAAVPCIDCVLVGEAEESFVELVKLLREGSRSEVQNIAGAVTKGTPSGKCAQLGRIEELDRLPFPARRLIDYSKYKSILTKSNPITTVITSRGCPFNCFFCSNQESGKKVRYRSAGNVVDELESLVQEYGIRDFLFFDELFTSNKIRTMQICDEIISRGLKIRWHCRSRVDVLDEEMVKKMKSAGCRLIQFGIETGNQRLQELINKKLNLEKVRETVSMVYASGILTYADFMFGLPTETDDEMRHTLQYAKSLKLDYIAFGMFHPIPGSIFYDQGIKEKKFEDFWLKYVKDQSYVIEDHSWTGKDRERHHLFVADAYRSFYLRPSYMAGRLLRMDSLPQLIWQLKSAVRVFYNLILKRFR
ncbi:MAG: radical SAM protein [Elusimicrobiota bacterium]